MIVVRMSYDWVCAGGVRYIDSSVGCGEAGGSGISGHGSSVCSGYDGVGVRKSDSCRF